MIFLIDRFALRSDALHDVQQSPWSSAVPQWLRMSFAVGCERRKDSGGGSHRVCACTSVSVCVCVCVCVLLGLTTVMSFSVMKMMKVDDCI